MVSKDHMVKGSCDFITILSRLVAIGIVVVKIQCFLEVEEKDFNCSRFSPSLLCISKGYDLKAHDISYW